MSGSLFASWARVRDPLNYAIQLGKYFNCTIPNDLTNDHNQVTKVSINYLLYVIFYGNPAVKDCF
jgi:ankyrin repeat protein